MTPRRCLARDRASLNNSRWPRSPPTLASSDVRLMPKRRLHPLRAALRDLDKRPQYAESAGHCSARGRDWASETPRSLRRPPSTFPLHCTHPSSSTDSTCLRPRHAMGYLRLVVIAVRQGTPRPAGGTVVGNFVQPPATISTGLDHLYACSRLRLGGGPQEDLGGGVLVNIGYVIPRLFLDQQPPDRDHR